MNDKSAVIYTKSWFVGANSSKACLIPFELACKLGSGRITSSGVCKSDLVDDLNLIFFALAFHFPDLGHKISQKYDWHVHMPSHLLQLTGSSNRLALAYAIYYSLNSDALVNPEETVLSGDLSLKGEVLPVKFITQKFGIWVESRLSWAVFSTQHQIPKRHGLHLISSLSDFAHLTEDSLQRSRCPIPPDLRRFGYGTACK